MLKQKEKKLPLSAKSNELHIESSEMQESCASFVYEPTNIEEASTGNLYITGEIKSSRAQSTYLINSLASIIKKELYRNHHRDSLESFEASLSKANNHLSDIASQGNIDWIGKINMVCALFTQNQLHISHTGSAKILLFRNTVLSHITDESPEEAPFPSKTFSNIISGPILAGDKLIFATTGLFRIASLEEIKHSLSCTSSREAIKNLGDLSEKDEDAPPSSVIVIDFSPITQAQENTTCQEKCIPEPNSTKNSAYLY
ncbi:MAG: hypothetical protein V1698_01400, partial [bacterium]